MSDKWRSVLPKDFSELLEELAKADAKVILIGGYAVGLHTEPRATKDIDFWIGEDKENLQRVVVAAAAFGAPAQTVEALADAKPGEFVTWGNPPGRVDLLLSLEGMPPFDEAYQSAQALAGKHSTARLISLEHLIIAKELSMNSPTRDEESAMQDRVDHLRLKKSLKRQRGQGR